jgi:hypothetical protein
MTLSRSFRLLAALTSILLVTIIASACGGSTPAGTSGAVGSVATSSKVVTLSGGVSGTISQPGGCGEAISDSASWEGMFQTDDGSWMLDITLEGTKTPGTYEAGWHDAGKASVWIYQGGGGATYEAAPGSGTVTLDADSQGGSLDVQLTNAADGSTTDVSGGWTCE